VRESGVEIRPPRGGVHSRRRAFAAACGARPGREPPEVRGPQRAAPLRQEAAGPASQSGAAVRALAYCEEGWRREQPSRGATGPRAGGRAWWVEAVDGSGGGACQVRRLVSFRSQLCSCCTCERTSSSAERTGHALSGTRAVWLWARRSEPSRRSRGGSRAAHQSHPSHRRPNAKCAVLLT